MRTVRQSLESKPVEIHAVPPDAPVIEAIRLMAEHHVGALLVIPFGAGELAARHP